MAETIHERMRRIAGDVAWRYARRVWWVDARDLEQQAWVVVLEVYKHHAPRREDGEVDEDLFGAFAHRACLRQLSTWLWLESSPASAPPWDAKELRGLHRAELDEGAAEDRPDPEQLVGEAEALERLRSRLAELVGPGPALEASFKVLLEGEAPRDVALAMQVDVWCVYRTNEAVKLAVKADEEAMDALASLAELRGWSR